MENQQDGIAVGSGMIEFERENLYEGYPKHTDMTEAIQQGANVDDTNEDQSVQLNDMTITATSSKVPLSCPGTVRDGSKNQANSQSPTKTKNRETEKVRKVRINNNIDKFLELIPNDQKIKLSKNQILETTYKYLADLKEKCQRYLTMDSESLQQERINDLLAENDRLKKENECFLEIFRTLNIQPNGLLEMNHQLKSVAKKEEKMAQNLLSPTQNFNQNMGLMLSPTGQSCDPSMQSNSQFTGSNLLSPTFVNGNIVLPQTMDGMQRDSVSGISLGNGCMEKKEQEVAVKNDLDSQQGDDMDQVFQEIMEATKSTPLMKTEEEVDPGRDPDDGVKDPQNNNPASISLTSSSQAFVNVSTHQPSITANEAPPKLTSAATTPSTMVTQSLSGPITTTSGVGIVTTAGQNCILGQPTVSTGMRVAVPPVTTVAASQPNIMLQQQGQTLLLSLPGRAGYIPVKIAPTVQKSSQPVLLPNQGQCGNLAKQLNTPQKRRPLKIKEQGKESTGQRSAAPTLTLPQVMQSGLGGPTGPQTMTVRLPVGGSNQHSGGVMFNSAPVVMQQTVQQPVVINTPGGGQQTVLMPVQIQQPVVQQPQQVVYIQQNGQLIPVVVNPPQQQVVSNSVIVNPVQQGQSMQGQTSSTGQPACSTNTTQFTQPTTAVDNTHPEGQNYQQFATSQEGGNSNVNNSLQTNLAISSQQNKLPNMNASDVMTSVDMTGDPVPGNSLNMGSDNLSSMTYPTTQKQEMAANDRHHFETGVMRPVEQSDDNTDPNDILAQAAEHIFTAGGDDASQQMDSHLGMDSSSAQEENSSHSKRKKKKKKKEKEKDKERGKDSKKDKKNKKGKKKNQEEDMQVEMSVPKDNNFSTSNDAIFERLLQETEQTSLENDAGDVNSRTGAAADSNHASVEVSQGDYLPDYPIQQPLSQGGGDKLVSQPCIINPVTSIGQEQPGENSDILSNSMNFIGLPTLAEENDEQSSKTCSDANTEEKTGKKDYSPIPAADPAKISIDQGGDLTSSNHDGGDDDDDDDDHDPEAHAFSPEESLDPETEGMKQSPFQEDPISSSELLSRSSRTETNPSYQVTPQSDHQDERKSPPPAYPVAVNKSLNKVTSSKQSSLDGRGSSQPFDILSQPWLTQSTTSSSQSLGTVASVLPQRTNTSDHSQNQTIMSHGNLRGYPRHHEALAVDSTLPSSNATAQHPVNVSNLYKSVGSTEMQLSRPTFNFYSSAANPQKVTSEAPLKGQSERSLSDTLDLNATSSAGLSGKTRRPQDAPQMSGGAPMRALEKPPINKSFTKANIHRTLTSFEKLESEEEKWRAEKEKAKAVKEPPKPPQAKKPSGVPEGEDEGDLVGHRALDKDLVNKFPWLADEDEPKAGGKGTSGKLTRSSTSFSVQSMAQSAAQNHGTRKRQDKTKGTVGLKDPNGGKTNTPPQGDGNSRQLWNPSFSKAVEKSRNDLPSSEDVTFARELKDTQIEKTQPTSRSAKGIPVSDQLLSDISEFGLRGKRKGPHAMSATAQQSLIKNTAELGGGKGTNQSVQLILESGLTSPVSSLPAYPSSQSLLQVSEPLGTPYSQYNASLFSSDSQSSTKPFNSKASSQSAFPKVSSADSNAPSLNNQERDQTNSDIFPGPDSLDFFFGKEHPDLPENMVETLQAEQNSAMNKQPMQAMRNSPFEQVPVSSPYGQLSPMNANMNRQLSQLSQRIPTSQTAVSRPASQPSAAGVKRPSNQMSMQPGGSHVKRHQKDSDIFRGSPSSDGNHMGSPETSSVPYGSPMMPPAASAADQQSSSGAVERPFRYQQGVQGFSAHSNVSGMQSSYNMTRGEQVPPKKSKTIQGQERNPEIVDVQSWSSQSVSSSIGSRSNTRSSQNASFISEMPSVSVPSGFSQNEVASNPGNSGLLSSLSPSRHLRPNELPTYLPSLSVRNPILTSPPYPGKGTSTRETDISFDSMFSSSRSNSLPLNVGHNYSVFPDHATHNTGLSTVKHGHVASHAPNSSGPFNFNNIFNDVTASSSQGHANPSPALNHSLHPTMHLGNALPSPGEESLPPLRGGVNQRHRNQQLGNAGMRGLEHLFSQNSGVDARGTFPMGPMGVPTHPYVPSMPPY